MQPQPPPPSPPAARATMPAAVLAAPGRIELTEAPVPEPGAGQARVRIAGCGVCASNLGPWKGAPWFQYPFAPGALGHEAWGVVDALGPGVDAKSGLAPGQPVALLSQRAYAAFDVAPAGELVALPEKLAGSPFPAEPLACALNVFRRGGIAAGQRVAVVGVGFLGALLVRLAVAAGAEVIACSRRAFALEIAARLGAAHPLALGEEAWPVIERVKELTGGEFCDVVIEAAGAQGVLDLAAELTRVRGRLVIAGYHQDGPRQVNLQLWNWRGLDVINAHERDSRVYVEGMRAAVAAAAAGRLDFAPLLTHCLPLAQLGEALELTRNRPPGFLKAWVAPTL